MAHPEGPEGFLSSCGVRARTEGSDLIRIEADIAVARNGFHEVVAAALMGQAHEMPQFVGENLPVDPILDQEEAGAV